MGFRDEVCNYQRGSAILKSILGEGDYESEVRKNLVPLIKISATNRFLMNRIGDNGFKMVARYWMRDQRKKEMGSNSCDGYTLFGYSERCFGL